MKLNVLESTENKLVIEVHGEDHTFLNILTERSWASGCKQASYIIEHPYLSKPKIIVMAQNPKKILDSAAQMIIEEAKAFEKEFKRALPKK